MEQQKSAPQSQSGWRRLNDGVARGEAAVAIGMLLLMLVVAFAQALLRNLTNFGFSWANVALEKLDWADFILSKGTLWLAFLGASLAVHGNKHIAIDIVPRLASPRVRLAMRGLVGLAGCVICIALSRAFWSAVMINGEERPSDMEILTLEGGVHVCDATAAQLGSASVEPGFYCYVRAVLALLGVRLETAGAAFQLIVPVMFVVMSVRMLAYGVVDLGRLARGEVDEQTGSAADTSGNKHS